MKRTTRWDRIADRWRIQLPVPRYLRHAPMRAMRESLWLVSRLQPKIDVTINVANSVRISSLAAAPSTVFVQRWVAEHDAVLQATRPEVAPGMPRLGLRLTATSPLARPRRETRPSSPAAGRMPQPAPSLQPVAETPARAAVVLVPRLANRVRRIDDLAIAPAARVVKRGSAAAVPDAISSSRETTDWGAARRGVPEAMPGFAPAQAAAAPAAVNVEQLTDQVLRQIDRRLVASRERLGRI